jgi:hypothetical protein
MATSRELDRLMAERILEHEVYFEKSGAMRERLPNGQTRPLRPYGTDIGAAWEVATKIGVTVIPIDGGWFALVGDRAAWASPAAFLAYMQEGKFAEAGAAVSEQASMAICLAAMRALEHRARSAAAALEAQADAANENNVVPLH